MDIPVEDVGTSREYTLLLRFLEQLLQHSPGGLTLDSVHTALRAHPQWAQLRPSEILDLCLVNPPILNFGGYERQIFVSLGEPSTTCLVASPGPMADAAAHPALSTVQSLPTEPYLRVSVARVENPELVVLNVTDENGVKAHAIWRDMTDFYSSSAGTAVPGERVQPGLMCAFPYSHGRYWGRGVVKHIHKEGLVDVEDVDNAQTVQVPFTWLRQLDSQFCVLPRQAIIARLGRIVPARGLSLDPQVCSRMEQLAPAGSMFTCNAVDYKESVPSVLLCNTDGSPYVLLHVQLVGDGFKFFPYQLRLRSVPELEQGILNIKL